MDSTVIHAPTSILDGLEHPSFPGRTIPAVLDGHTPPTWCLYCEQLAAQIRACERLGDRDGMTAYGWQAIRHVSVAHPSYGLAGRHGDGHNLAGGAR